MAEFDPQILNEPRIAPPEEFQKRARVKSLREYQVLYDRAAADPEGFWLEQAELVEWFTRPAKTLEWREPFAKWFVGGKLNVSYNCLDRHLTTRANKPALLWEGKDGKTVQLTYAELHGLVCRFANVLLSLDVKAGDCVAIYMPLIPELLVALQACARIGAAHHVVFGGFSAPALAGRLNTAGAKVRVTADGGYRRGRVVPLKEAADAAAEKCPTIKKVVVVRRTGAELAWKAGRDFWWDDVMTTAARQCEAVPFDAEHPLFILYTSGT